MISDDLVDFVQRYLQSVWALRLMLVLMREPDRQWSANGLVNELRASYAIVSRGLARFARIGLALEVAPDVWAWRPAAPELAELARKVAEAYETTPFGVIQAIAEAPEDDIRRFADAFRIRKDE